MHRLTNIAGGAISGNRSLRSKRSCPSLRALGLVLLAAMGTLAVAPLASSATTTTVAPTTTTTTAPATKLSSKVPSRGVGSFRTLKLPVTDTTKCIVATSSGAVWSLTTTPGNTWEMLEITPAGKVMRFPQPDVAPLVATSVCLALGPDGNLWFTDPFAQRRANGPEFPAIGRFNTTTHTTTFFATPTGISDPATISSSADSIWFVDAKTDELAEIDTSGRFHRLTLPSGDTGVGGLAADGTNVWVATTNATSGPMTIELSPGGQVVASIVDAPSAVNELVYAPNGRLYFAYNNGVGEASATQTFEQIAGTALGPQTMVLGPDGRLWYASAWFGCLYSLYGYAQAHVAGVQVRIPGCAGGIADGPNGTVVVSADSSVLYFVQTGATPKAAARGATPAPITHLESPARIFSSPVHTIINAGITLGIILFITFPSQLFNQTFQENYDDLRAAWERRLKSLARARERLSQHRGDRSTLVIFIAVVLVGAFLDTLLNPHVSANASWAASFVATICALLVGIAVPTYVARTYRTARHQSRASVLHALPAGLAIAGACVVISRVSDFSPGYFYGLICGVTFTSKLEKKEQGHIVALSTIATIVVAVAAWFCWVPVSVLVSHAHPSIGTIALDDFLASVFNGGLVGSVFSLLPLSFLPGSQLFAWHRLVWAATFGVACFGLIQVMLRPVTGATHPGGAPIITVVILFVIFGGASIWFRYHFAHRKAATSAHPDPPPDGNLAGQVAASAASASTIAPPTTPPPPSGERR